MSENDGLVFSNDFNKFESYYPQLYPVYDKAIEEKRNKNNKLINFDKVFNDQYNSVFDDLKFFTMSDVSLNCYNFQTGETLNLTEYISAIKLIDNFEVEIMTKIEVDLLIPSQQLEYLLNKLSMTEVPLRFYISPNNKDFYSNKTGVESTLFNYNTLLNAYPHSNVAYVAIEYPTDKLIPSSKNKTSSRDSNSYKFTMILLSELALRLRSAQFSHKAIMDKKNVDVTITNNIVDSMLEKIKELMPELSIMKKKLNNSQRFNDISFENQNIFGIIKYLDEFYGTHLFGSVIYVEGSILYIGDKQLESINKNVDIYLKVKMDLEVDQGGVAYIPTFRDNTQIGEFVEQNVEFRSIYIFVDESAVRPNFYNSSAKLLAGERVLVRYLNEDTVLLLPRSLTATALTGFSKLDLNDANDSEESKSFFSNLFSGPKPADLLEKMATTVRYEKTKFAYFFESKLISDYNDSLGFIDVYLEGVNPDLFHHGKHIYVQFANSTYAYLYNWEYKVVIKEVLYPIANKATGSKVYPKLRVTLKRVVDELPYSFDSIITNSMYRETKDDVAKKEVDAGQQAKLKARINAEKENMIKNLVLEKKGNLTYLSEFVTLEDMMKSETATANRISNIPTIADINRFRTLAVLVIDKINIHFSGANRGKVLQYNSSYRNEKVNTLVGGSLTSQHPKGEAMDFAGLQFKIPGVSLENVWRWCILQTEFEFDQLIYEFGSWIHISYTSTLINGVSANRNQIMIAKGSSKKPIYSYYTLSQIQNNQYTL